MTVEREIELPPYRFWERRVGSGSPVVLIHGLGGSADWWKRNYDALSAEHLVCAVDLVGFGRNRFFLRRSSLPLTFVEIAALLSRWLRSSFDVPVHLVGNSMGGQIAIHLAAEHPDLVRSLTLVNSTGIPFEIAPGAHLENLIVPRGALSFATIIARDALRSGPTAVALALARLLRDDARPLMRELKLPVLLLWGERDPLVPLTYGRQMSEVIPNSRLIPIPNAGHIPMWENAETFNRELLTFIGEVERRDPGPGGTAQFSWGLAGWTEGIAHREAGTRRDLVLIHGLGMSSAYFVHLARALFERGWNPIAPDLPGFGESVDGPALSAEGHARVLAAWADALGIQNAAWVGHSIGCNVVEHLATMRSDLCRAPVMIGPLWTRRSHPVVRMFGMLVIDALREPLALYGYVLPAYWRVGLARWWKTFWKYVPDFVERRACRASSAGDTPAAPLVLCGERDPLPDRECVEVQELPGAHACTFSHASECADVINTLRDK